MASRAHVARSCLISAVFALVGCSAPTSGPDAANVDETPDAGTVHDSPDGGAANDSPDGGAANDSPDAGATDTPDAGGTVTGPWPPAKYTTFNASGTRLTATAIVDEEGNSQIAWFTDTQLNVRCTVRTAADGLARCVPVATPVGGVLMTGDGASFADASCTTPVLRAPTHCATGTWFRDGATIYRRTGAATEVYVAGSRNGVTYCTRSTLAAGESAITMNAVPATDFVAFAERHTDVDATFGARWLEGDDGSRLAAGLWSVPHAQPAQVVNGRLVPYVHTKSNLDLAQLACTGTTGQGFVADVVTPRPAYMQLIFQTPRGPILEWRAITSHQTLTCNGNTPVAAPAGQTVYVIAPTATPETDFAAITMKTDEREGQRFRHFVTADNQPLVPYPATAHGLSPVIGTAAREVMLYGGSLVYPTAAWQQPYLYGNNTCTDPVFEDGSAASGDLVLRFAGDLRAACDVVDGVASVEALWTVGNLTPMSRATYYANGSTCEFAQQMPIRLTTSGTANAATLLPAIRTGAP